MEIFGQLEIVEERYEKLNELLSDPDVVSDTKKLMEYSKEQRSIEKTVAVFREYKDIVQQIKTLLLRFVEQLVEMKHNCLQVIYYVCTLDLLNLKDGK